MKFADRILGDWDRAMDRFFRDVDEKRRVEGLSDDEVGRALNDGYGPEVCDAWNDWVGVPQ